MLNIFKQDTNIKNKKKIIKDYILYTNNYPSSIREWDNSIYTYNKYTFNHIPQVTLSSIKLIKSYFNLYNLRLERKVRENKLLSRLRRTSSNKIYISNGEFKHTTNKVIVTLYLFNRQRHNYLLNIDKRYINKFKHKFVKINKILDIIKNESFKYIEKLNKIKYLLINILNVYNNDKNKLINNYKSLSNYINVFYKKLIRKYLKSLILFLYYKQLLFINESKLNYNYLQYLKKYLEKLYGKNIEFNLVNIRQFYLNSEILSESIILKIKRNRRKLLKYLNILKKKIKVKKKKYLYEIDLTYYNKYINKNNIEKIILRNIKHKHITGFRLENKGRLTKRYTASRSISKLIYKGNLSNLDSSYNSMSSVLLRGHLKSNIQFTKLNSKTRIGSFGVKGWISGN